MTEQMIIDDPDRSAPDVRTIAMADGVRADITIPRYGRFAVALTHEARDEDRRRREVLHGKTTAETAAIVRVFDPVQVTIGQKLIRTPDAARFRRNPGHGAILGYVCAVENAYHRSNAGISYKSTRARNSVRSTPSQAKRRKIRRGH